MKEPKLSDGSPKGYCGNHHLWYIKQYREWVEAKTGRAPVSRSSQKGDERKKEECYAVTKI